jgi:c-di-GMP-binding flagellar brake protein YcgR
MSLGEPRQGGQERRRYFRVVDQLMIGYSVVVEEPALTTHRMGAQATAIGQLENMISESLAKIRSNNPVLTEVLELFNRKINLALSIDEKRLHNVDAAEKSMKDVNLSACGIAFPVEDAIAVGTALVLDMTLLPSFINLNLKAQVIGASPLAEAEGADKYMLRADFLELSDVEQELLVQHVIRCQALALKARREAREK